MKHPQVSIGMPVYNGERYITEVLNSILGQTFGDFEVIISDNASTDQTEEICRSFAQLDSRIQYFRNSSNLGAAANFNRTFALSRGEYFKWAAHDDILAPEFLERCVAVLDQNSSVVLCYSREIWIDEFGNHISKHFNLLNFLSKAPDERFKEYLDLWRLRGFVHANHCFGLIRSSQLKLTSLIGGYPWAELVLGMELLLLGEFVELPEYLFFFRCHSNSSRAIRRKDGFEGLALWFDPSNRDRKILMPNFNLFLEYFKRIKCSSMRSDQKIYCYFQMLKWFSWKWKMIAREFIVVLLSIPKSVFSYMINNTCTIPHLKKQSSGF